MLTHIFCQWNFLDPLETKTGDAKQERAFEQVFRQILRRVNVLIALPLHSRKAPTRLLAVSAIAETASVSLPSTERRLIAARRRRAARGVSMH